MLTGRITLISALLLAVVLLFSSCAGAGGDSANTAAYPSSAIYQVEAPASPAMFDYDSNVYYDDGMYYEERGYDSSGGSAIMGEGGSYLSASSQNPAGGLKIIYTAGITIRTLDWDESLSYLMELLDVYEAYIQNSYISGGYVSPSGYYNERQASLTVRVPASYYRSFLRDVEGAGTVIDMNEYTDDITAAYIDTEARLKSLRLQEERLLSMLSVAGELSDLIEIESKLGEVRYQIESYESVMNTYSTLLSYSTVTVNMREASAAVIPKDTFGQRVFAAIRGSWNAVVGFLDGLVVALIYAGPFIAIGVAVLSVVRRVTRKARLARKEARLARKEARLARKERRTAEKSADEGK